MDISKSDEEMMQEAQQFIKEIYPAAKYKVGFNALAKKISEIDTKLYVMSYHDVEQIDFSTVWDWLSDLKDIISEYQKK